MEGFAKAYGRYVALDGCAATAVAAVRGWTVETSLAQCAPDQLSRWMRA